jgi:altronate dehydratase small subunit
MKKALQINSKDNVVTATYDIEMGENIEVISPEGEIILEPTTIDNIPFGHKLTIVELVEGDEIIKYGEVIGIASRSIQLGEWVHTHNVESARLPTKGTGV